MIALVSFVAIVAVIVMAIGEDDSDQTGDLRYVKGKQPRREASLPIAATMADIATADVHQDGSELVFRIASAAPVPRRLKRSSLNYRFDISGEEGGAWIVSATVKNALNAGAESQTDGHKSTTVDGTFPGSVEASGEEITITLEPQRIDNFPESFDWTLSSNLIAFRNLAGSTHVEDRYPDEGTISGP